MYSSDTNANFFVNADTNGIAYNNTNSNTFANTDSVAYGNSGSYGYPNSNTEVAKYGFRPKLSKSSLVVSGVNLII